jgi:hypothetical protein
MENQKHKRLGHLLIPVSPRSAVVYDKDDVCSNCLQKEKRTSIKTLVLAKTNNAKNIIEFL